MLHLDLLGKIRLVLQVKRAQNMLDEKRAFQHPVVGLAADLANGSRRRSSRLLYKAMQMQFNSIGRVIIGDIFITTWVIVRWSIEKLVYCAGAT
jgi:hypothetical protein